LERSQGSARTDRPRGGGHRTRAGVAVQQPLLAQAHGQAAPRSRTALLRHVPNAITVSRILLIPVFVLVFLEPTPNRALAAAAVFGLAASTDAVDGYIDRRWDHIPRVGKLVKPNGDKVLVLTEPFV